MIRSLFFIRMAALVALLHGSAFSQQPENRVDDQGLKQGPWKGYFHDGKLRYTGQFVDDEPTGVFRYYYARGAVRAELVHEPGQDTVQATYFYPNGKILSTGFFAHQQKAGEWDYFSEQGVLVARNNYHQGVEHGVAETFFANGQVTERVTWQHGKKHGPWLHFFEDGSPRLVAGYHDDLLTGPFEVYYPNGQQVLQATYLDNFPHDTWRYYSQEGELEKEIVYDRGVVIEEQIYIEREEEETIPLRPGEDPSKNIFDSQFGF